MQRKILIYYHYPANCVHCRKQLCPLDVSNFHYLVQLQSIFVTQFLLSALGLHSIIPFTTCFLFFLSDGRLTSNSVLPPSLGYHLPLPFFEYLHFLFYPLMFFQAIFLCVTINFFADFLVKVQVSTA